MDFQVTHSLPDIADPIENKDWGAPLQWVGMSGIEMPIRLPVSFHKKTKLIHIPARLDFHVDLIHRQSRGIHMSRLYRLLTESVAERNMDFGFLNELAAEALRSHQGLSHKARLAVRFDLPCQRTSLKSNLSGWRSYPVTMIMEKSSRGARRWLETQVLYSSTCPASTALAEQLQMRELPGSHFVATPHAQRSGAHVSVELKADAVLDAETLVTLLESALKTPVQTAVKREDEQEFSRLNAQNQMFCEDAARRIVSALSTRADLLNFKGEVRHFESLHPHDATAFFASAESAEQPKAATWSAQNC